MKFENELHKLKSGKLITIRPPEVNEAQDVLNLKRDYLKNTTSLPLTLDEYPSDLSKESKLINTYEISQNSVFLVAEYNNEFIGNIDLTGSKRTKMYHTAMIGMGIKESCRNQGLGKILIKCVIEWAKNNSDIEIVWLDVYATNELGYNLYKNMGFEVSGIIKGFFKDGKNYIDKVQMYQRIR